MKIVVIAIITTLVYLVYLNFTAMHQPIETFNSREWKERSNEFLTNDPGCVRGGMALDLMESKIITGLDKPAVLEVLGKPNRAAATSLGYDLGQCHWDWKASYLEISFDNDYLVKKLKLISPTL